MNDAERIALYNAVAALVRGQRWAALATVDEDGAPHASMVAYAPEADLAGLLLHLSRLARHTRYLLAQPQASLVISAPDTSTGDPQTLPRVAVDGLISAISPDDPAYAAARSCYLARLPDAEPRFDFADFMLLRFEPQNARYVGGFARAHSLGRQAWLALGGASEVA